MAVLKSQRHPTDVAYFYDAIELRKEMTLLLLRNFGVKDKVRSVKFFTQMVKMDQEDAENFQSILDKYSLGKTCIDEYPEWLIDKFRVNIMNTLYQLIESITLADSIQTPQSLELCQLRKSYQQKAIGFCNMLLQEMQYIMQILPIDVEKLIPYVDKINKEINNLKHWRKKCNKDFLMFNEKA